MLASSRSFSSKLVAGTPSMSLAALRCFGSTQAPALPMKAGTVLKGLGLLKGQDPPVVKERGEYPAWVDTLAEPLPNLVKLRKIPNEEAEEEQIMRFLKLNRRLTIRQRNEESSN